MWSRIVGHGPRIAELKADIASGRLPNAYLFAGPKGVGKRMAAEAMAMALACQVPPAPGEACGSCAGCRRALARGHPDIFLVAAEAEYPDFRPPPGKERKPSEEIRIEQIRDLKSRIQFHPLEARAKLVIIVSADRMTISAANSLLKALEEPPSATHFVLTSSSPHGLLATIRSRSRWMSFGPLPEGEIAAILMRERGLSGEDSLRIARLSGGSAGRALATDPEFVAAVMGRFATLAGRAASADIIEAAEEWSLAKGHEPPLILDLIASWYRDRLKFLSTGANDRMIHANAAGPDCTISAGKAEAAIREIAAARRALDTTANKQLLFEHLLFTLTA